MSYFSTIEFPPSNKSAFGDLEVAFITPLVHWSFATGLRNQLTTTSSVSTGVADTLGGRLRLQTGTNSAGSAIAQSTKPASYRPGQGIICRFTAIWLTSAANSTQIFGAGNDQNGYFYGYSGTSFGIIHRNGGADTFIPQTTWNGDICDGTGVSGFNWNEATGVPLMIKYPYLGYGNITFWVQNPDTSAWILTHTIKYANTSASTQLSNPSLSLYGQVVNTGSTTNLTMYVGSAGMYLAGEKEYLGPMYGFDNSKATITTETSIIALKSCTSINGVTNRGISRIRSVSFAGTAASAIITCRIKRGATLGGVPAFSGIDGTTVDNGVTLTAANSIISRDIAGTTVTGGTILFNSLIAFNTSVEIDMTPYDLYIAPGETLVISMTSTASATVACAVNWQEDVQ
jgi:hypothetical protein